MEYRYYRYAVEGTLSPEDISRALGETGGIIVRVDNRDGRTEVTVATSGGPGLAAEPPLGAGVEVREDAVLNAGNLTA